MSVRADDVGNEARAKRFDPARPQIPFPANRMLEPDRLRDPVDAGREEESVLLRGRVDNRTHVFAAVVLHAKRQDIHGSARGDSGQNAMNQQKPNPKSSVHLDFPH